MSPDAIFDALVARIKADTGSGGLYEGNAFTIITGEWWGIEGPSLTDLNTLLPYGVINITMEPNDAFDADGCNFVVDFTVFDRQASGMANISKAFSRLYGNAMASSGRIPSYGFQRQNLVLSTDPIINPLALVGEDMVWAGARTDGPTSTTVISASTQFRGSASAIAVSP